MNWSRLQTAYSKAVFLGETHETLPREQTQKRNEIQTKRRKNKKHQHHSRTDARGHSAVTCFHPIKALKTPDGVVFNAHINNIQLPCGMCIGCRMRRNQDWKIRCVHEAQMWTHNCFITLTYARDRLPPNASLHKADFQNFMKRLREKVGPAQPPTLNNGVLMGPRYYMCGEYGPANQRPHYHACIFGYNFLDRTPAGKSKSGELFYTSKELEKLWGHGRTSVQDFTPETASYVSGYIMQAALGPTARKEYEDTGRIPPYNNMSLKPGIGELWYKKYNTDITHHDIAVAAGREHQVPKYYDKLSERYGHVDLDQVKSKRVQKASEHKEDQTPARLKVREHVTKARMRNHERSNDL